MAGDRAKEGRCGTGDVCPTAYGPVAGKILLDMILKIWLLEIRHLYFEKLLRRFLVHTWGVMSKSTHRNLGLMAGVWPGHWVVSLHAGER